MPKTIKEYWRDVWAKAVTLDPDTAPKDLRESQKRISLISVEDGHIVTVRPLIAAQWITSGTHRLVKS